MKKVCLLGASGSIGSQSIEVIKNHLDELELVGVSVGNNVASLLEILKSNRNIIFKRYNKNFICNNIIFNWFKYANKNSCFY